MSDHDACWHIPKWQSGFTLGLDGAKSIDYIEKYIKQKLRRIKFPTKNLVEVFLIHTKSGVK